MYASLFQTPRANFKQGRWHWQYNIWLHALVDLKHHEAYRMRDTLECDIVLAPSQSTKPTACAVSNSNIVNQINFVHLLDAPQATVPHIDFGVFDTLILCYGESVTLSACRQVNLWKSTYYVTDIPRMPPDAHRMVHCMRLLCVHIHFERFHSKTFFFIMKK